MVTDSMDKGKAGERSGALEISTDNVRLTGVSSTGPATPSLTPAGSTSSPADSPCRLVCRRWKSFGRRTIGRVKGMIGIEGGAAKIAAVSQRHRRHPTSIRNMRRGKMMDKNGAHRSSDHDPQGAASGSVLLSGGHSVKGMNRPDKNNEDEFFQFDDLFSVTSVPPPDGLEKLGAFGVFDGHGGASCSSFVCRHLPVEVARSPEWKRLARVDIESCKREPINSRSDELLSDVMRGALLDGFRKTQEKFLEFANARRKDSGSTAAVALVCGREVVIANLGDSEALFCDNCTLGGNSGPIIARTQCHDAKNPAERERVEAAGGDFSNGRLFGVLCPTRSFGDRDIIRIKEGVLTAVPEVHRYRTLSTTGSAFLLLGTDGLWGNVSEDKVVGLIQADFRRRAKRNRAAKPSRIAQALVREAGKIFLGDDATAVVVLFT